MLILAKSVNLLCILATRTKQAWTTTSMFSKLLRLLRADLPNWILLNDGYMKYMRAIRENVTKNELVTENFIFEAVTNFVYLVTTNHSNNDASLEFQRRITIALIRK